VNNWIYPFKGRNRSLSCDQNFLWNEGNIYIMDNHRAALWCWLRHIDSRKEYGLFHIDAHYDAASISKTELAIIPDISVISFEEYLNITTYGVGDEELPMIRWDNYLYLYQARYSNQISDFFTATHQIGDEPLRTIHWEEVHMSQLPLQLDELLAGFGKSGWILNVDLDYFFARQPDGYGRIHSQYYINSAFSVIKKYLESGKVICLTICLSPECCGGWDAAEKLCYEFCDILGIDFRLPQSA